MQIRAHSPICAHATSLGHLVLRWRRWERLQPRWRARRPIARGTCHTSCTSGTTAAWRATCRTSRCASAGGGGGGLCANSGWPAEFGSHVEGVGVVRRGGGDCESIHAVSPALAACVGATVQPRGSQETPETKRRMHNLLAVGVSRGGRGGWAGCKPRTRGAMPARALGQVSGLLDSLTTIKPRYATDEEVLRFHTKRWLDHVKAISALPSGGCHSRCARAPTGFSLRPRSPLPCPRSTTDARACGSCITPSPPPLPAVALCTRRPAGARAAHLPRGVRHRVAGAGGRAGRHRGRHEGGGACRSTVGGGGWDCDAPPPAAGAPWQVRNAYALVRPPGHHAEADEGHG
jgi:hypothetical protein